MKAKHLLLFSLLSINGCALSADEQTSAEQPALLITPSNESLLELQAVAATLLVSKHILLSEDAFTKHSELTIERIPHKNKDGQLIMGRGVEMPYTLQMIKKDGNCFLKDISSEKIIMLTISDCVIK